MPLKHPSSPEFDETSDEFRNRMISLGLWEEVRKKANARSTCGVDPTISFNEVRKEYTIDAIAVRQGKETMGTRRLSLINELTTLVDPDKTADSYEEVKWAAQHILTPLESIDPDRIPSLGALGWLFWVQESPQNETVFRTTILSKTIPSRSEIEHRGLKEGTNRAQEEVQNSFLKHMESDRLGGNNS